MRWETTYYGERLKRYYGEEEKYEFFVSNVSSKEELKDRLKQLVEWVRKNID